MLMGFQRTWPPSAISCTCGWVSHTRPSKDAQLWDPRPRSSYILPMHQLKPKSFPTESHAASILMSYLYPSPWEIQTPFPSWQVTPGLAVMAITPAYSLAAPHWYYTWAWKSDLGVFSQLWAYAGVCPSCSSLTASTAYASPSSRNDQFMLYLPSHMVISWETKHMWPLSLVTD